MEMDTYNQIVLVCLYAILAIVLGLLVYFARKYWQYRKRVVSYADVPLPGITPFDGQDVRCTCEHGCGKHEKLPESIRVGSNFTSVPISRVPRVQIPIYSVDKNGRVLSYRGVATRIADWLIVPLHVIVSEEAVAALTLTPVPQALKIDVSKFEPIDGDLAAMKLSEASFSQLGMSKATLTGFEGETMASVCSASKEPEMSFGTLVHDKSVFGGLVFRGSTRGGFSGSAYMIGKQIAGIHLGGGVVNYGVSSTYILALLKKPEETAEWLQRIRAKNGKLRATRSKFNPDEAIVYIGGRYIVVDRKYLEDDDYPTPGQETTATREVEVNLSQNFPPAYVDIAEPVVNAINTISSEMQSKNAEVAEQCSADQAAEYMKMYAEKMAVLDEKMMILQSLQDSVSNRYRETMMDLTKTKGNSDATRSTLVEENEKLKKELSEIKALKTSANVEVSSLKAIHPSVKKANGRKEGATILDRMAASGFSIEEVIRALEKTGRVQKVAAEPVGNAVNMIAPMPEQQASTSTSPSATIQAIKKL